MQRRLGIEMRDDNRRIGKLIGGERGRGASEPRVHICAPRDYRVRLRNMPAVVAGHLFLDGVKIRRLRGKRLQARPRSASGALGGVRQSGSRSGGGKGSKGKALEPPRRKTTMR